MENFKIVCTEGPDKGVEIDLVQQQPHRVTLSQGYGVTFTLVESKVIVDANKLLNISETESYYSIELKAGSGKFSAGENKFSLFIKKNIIDGANEPSVLSSEDVSNTTALAGVSNEIIKNPIIFYLVGFAIGIIFNLIMPEYKNLRKNDTFIEFLFTHAYFQWSAILVILYLLWKINENKKYSINSYLNNISIVFSAGIFMGIFRDLVDYFIEIYENNLITQIFTIIIWGSTGWLLGFHIFSSNNRNSAMAVMIGVVLGRIMFNISDSYLGSDILLTTTSTPFMLSSILFMLLIFKNKNVNFFD